jgi:lipoic acid synthetase
VHGPALPRPPWIKARAPLGEGHARLDRLLRELSLNTVCEEARCPNLGECWNRGTATFMILGDVCTRACGFCAVKTGLPGRPADPEEPRRVAEAVRRMGLRHAVITSVNRDDQRDGGAASFAACVREIRARLPGCTVELLVPDFKGDLAALALVLEARPDILNHNTETVPRLYRQVRPGARFERSLLVLREARRAGLVAKSGVMVGLGEEWAELLDTLARIREAGTDILTVGQYLRPSLQHLPIRRFYTPEEFERLAEAARSLGFAHVESGPLVRSSYHAEEQTRQARAGGPLQPSVPVGGRT